MNLIQKNNYLTLAWIDFYVNQNDTTNILISLKFYHIEFINLVLNLLFLLFNIQIYFSKMGPKKKLNLQIDCEEISEMEKSIYS